MKLANISIYFVFSLLLLITTQVVAEEWGRFTYSNGINLTQNTHEPKQLELSQGQMKSRVEHALVNYLLGHSIDQYLEIGTDDVVARKSGKHIKLRVNEHYIMLMYQRSLD